MPTMLPRACFLPLIRRADPLEAEGLGSRYGGRAWYTFAQHWRPDRCCGAPLILLFQLRTEALPGRPIPFSGMLVQVRACALHPQVVFCALLEADPDGGMLAPAADCDPPALAIVGWQARADAPHPPESVQEDKLLGHPLCIQPSHAAQWVPCPECGATSQPLFTLNDWISRRPALFSARAGESLGEQYAARSAQILALQSDQPRLLEGRPATPVIFGDAGWLTVLFCPQHPTWLHAITSQM